MHKEIERFHIDGETDGAHLIACRENFERWLLIEMRDQGYVPHLDLSSVFTVQWHKDDKYKFEVSMYGVYVGDVENVEGVSDGRTIYRRTNRSGSP